LRYGPRRWAIPLDPTIWARLVFYQRDIDPGAMDLPLQCHYADAQQYFIAHPLSCKGRAPQGQNLRNSNDRRTGPTPSVRTGIGQTAEWNDQL